jgi:hypothetical protein
MPGSSLTDALCFEIQGVALMARYLTYGLRISDGSTSENLTPQETTNQDALEMRPDGAGWFCPGSRWVK